MKETQQATLLASQPIYNQSGELFAVELLYRSAFCQFLLIVWSLSWLSVFSPRRSLLIRSGNGGQKVTGLHWTISNSRKAGTRCLSLHRLSRLMLQVTAQQKSWLSARRCKNTMFSGLLSVLKMKRPIEHFSIGALISFRATFTPGQLLYTGCGCPRLRCIW